MGEDTDLYYHVRVPNTYSLMLGPVPLKLTSGEKFSIVNGSKLAKMFSASQQVSKSNKAPSDLEIQQQPA
jgi:hypothetical protein